MVPMGGVSHTEPPKVINRENKSANDCGEGAPIRVAHRVRSLRQRKAIMASEVRNHGKLRAKEGLKTVAKGGMDAIGRGHELCL